MLPNYKSQAFPLQLFLISIYRKFLAINENFFSLVKGQFQSMVYEAQFQKLEQMISLAA